MFTRRTSTIEPAVKPAGDLQYRSISVSALIPRPREVVWAELEEADHPAWTTPDVGGEQEHYLRGDRTLNVGNVRIFGPISVPPFGLRQIWWTEVTQIMRGWTVTTETYTGVFDHSETVVLQDHQQGTLAGIEGNVRRVTTPEHADFAVGLMTRMAGGALRREHQRKLSAILSCYSRQKAESLGRRTPAASSPIGNRATHPDPRLTLPSHVNWIRQLLG